MPDTTYPGPESISRFHLSNGIVVLTYKNLAAESVVVEGLVRAGALAESREQAGLASITAEMLMRGTKTRDFDETFELIESVGASLHFGGGRHMTDFSGKSLAEDLSLMLELLADSLRQPTFPDKQLEAVRGEAITSIQIRQNDTRRMAALTFRESLYENHPYGQSVDGYMESVTQITRDDLVRFHDTYYGPKDMVIVLVGAIEPEDALAKIEAAFGDWENDQRTLPAVPRAERPQKILRVNIEMPEKTQSDIVLGLPGPLRSARDYLEASMANTILGVFGMMGRLGKNVREKQGLAYYAFSRLHGGLGPAPWYVSTGVAPDKVEQAIESILHELDRLRNEPIPEEELADSQAFRTGSLPVSLETNDGLASVITDIEVYDLGLDYMQKLPDKFNAMTPESVQAAARKYLSTEHLAITVAGPIVQEDS